MRIIPHNCRVAGELLVEPNQPPGNANQGIEPEDAARKRACSVNDEIAAANVHPLVREN
jgi:hypothetical protein